MSDPAIGHPSGGAAVWVVVIVIVVSLAAVVFFGVGIVEEFRRSQDNVSGTPGIDAPSTPTPR